MTNDHEAAMKLYEDPCPRCACHVVYEFQCNCGEVHGDVCQNCGRFRSAGKRSTELGITDEICTHGYVMHDHLPAEKTARIDRWYEFLNAHRPAESISDMEEAKRHVKRIMDEYRRTKASA